MAALFRFFSAGILLFSLSIGCQQITKSEFEFTRNTITVCGPNPGLSLVSFQLPGNYNLGLSSFQENNPRLLSPTFTGLPKVVANDNRTPAGKLTGNLLELKLEVVWADLRPETNNRPGLRVLAIAEAGKLPSIPAPLIRTKTGTRIRVTIRNTLTDSAITVFGMQKRPAVNRDSLIIDVGKSSTLEFETGEPGTYFYWIRNGVAVQTRTFDDPEEEQLAGAFIIDPKEGSPPDRIFVMNVFSARNDTTISKPQWLEALTVNGKSWPFTELQKPNVGDTLRWRVINASDRQHPMHLHGFYYDVLSRGSLVMDDLYSTKNRRTVVTETMKAKSTMTMEWVASRPGKWLFHCHLSFHVSHEIRLPGASEADLGDHEVHMAGLVLGIEIPPGPTDLIYRGTAKNITLYANDYNDSTGSPHGFSFSPNPSKSNTPTPRPGPTLVLKQYQETNVTVVNNMSVPTSIHWHGLELDSWADGVAGWSSSDGKVSPVIQPGERFTYKLSLLRAGTFIYHSHLDDVHQLCDGLYGPLIVVGENETFNPKTEHLYIKGWKTPEPTSVNDLDLNGVKQQPDKHVGVGEEHRIRLMNIAPAGNHFIRMVRGDQSYPLKIIAKDGADLPEHQHVDMDASPKFGVGETADFIFSPDQPGEYKLLIGGPVFGWRQTWIVTEK